MSSLENIKKDLKQVKEQWDQLDPNVRYLDIITLICVAIFAVSFFYVYIFEVALIITNALFMMFPAILAAYIFIYRSKLNDPESDNDVARKEFLTSMSIFLAIVGFSFVYYLMLE
ncbi:MAG: hypothetical protein ACW99A_08285 [Candidatus Kariarchaeaceae archaeon]